MALVALAPTAAAEDQGLQVAENGSVAYDDCFFVDASSIPPAYYVNHASCMPF